MAVSGQTRWIRPDASSLITKGDNCINNYKPVWRATKSYFLDQHVDVAKSLYGDYITYHKYERKKSRC